MQPNTDTLADKVAIVTGSARRIGATTVTRLHTAGARVVIHYRGSSEAAVALVSTLNAVRQDSAIATQADLEQDSAADSIVNAALEHWGRLDILVNNASAFYPTAIGSIKSSDVDKLFSSNFRAPLFLCQSAAPHLQKNQGCIVNMIDVHAYRPHPGHPVYCSAKAALLMLTRSLAVELAPDVRVNGIAPGSILWPEGDASLSAGSKTSILDGIPLNRNGTPDDIANTIAFLASPDANYITGQIIAVDGGRSL